MSLGVGDLFDTYGRQARLFPGLLTIFCPLILVLAWYPSLLLTSIGAALVTIASTCGLLYGLASLARTKGKEVEERLLQEWGGWPTTHLLRHSSSLEPATRARYHRFLSSNVPGMSIPSADKERMDPAAADASYASAVRWLKEHTRGADFSLLLRENSQYGFRRNLRGMRSLGIWLCSTALSVSLLITVLRLNPLFASGDWSWGAASQAVGSVASSVLPAAGLNAIAIYVWVTFVTDDWVKRGAYQYAYALLATCDLYRGPSSPTDVERR